MKFRSMLSVVAVVTACCTFLGLTACRSRTAGHVHSLIYVEEKKADCENGGNVEYWICGECGLTYADEAATEELTAIETQPLGHDLSQWTASTESHSRSCQREGCDKTETHTHTLDENNHCPVCGYTYEITGTEGLAYTAIETNGETIGYSVSIGDATASEIIIPYYYKGKPVTAIAESGFADALITSIDIPDSVISIGKKAFYRSKLEGALVISDYVTYIGSEAFFYCTALTKVTIGNGLQIIQTTTFSGCSGLQSVIIGDRVMFIYTSAFLNCSNLKTVLIGSGINTIQDGAFNSCKSITAVYYHGSADAWKNIGVISPSNNSYIYKATKYYYSETQPSGSEKYWHYDENGDPVVW